MVGGNWRYENDNGLSSAYRSLHIDTSRKNLGYSDFPIPETEPDLARLHVCGTYRGVSVRVWAFIGQLTGSAVAQS